MQNNSVVSNFIFRIMIKKEARYWDSHKTIKTNHFLEI